MCNSRENHCVGVKSCSTSCSNCKMNAVLLFNCTPTSIYMVHFKANFCNIFFLPIEYEGTLCGRRTYICASTGHHVTFIQNETEGMNLSKGCEISAPLPVSWSSHPQVANNQITAKHRIGAAFVVFALALLHSTL